eukprot:10360457-Lingulodinium_polyedra.AAC.1
MSAPRCGYVLARSSSLPSSLAATSAPTWGARCPLLVYVAVCVAAAAGILRRAVSRVASALYLAMPRAIGS